MRSTLRSYYTHRASASFSVDGIAIGCIAVVLHPQNCRMGARRHEKPVLLSEVRLCYTSVLQYEEDDGTAEYIAIVLDPRELTQSCSLLLTTAPKGPRAG